MDKCPEQCPTRDETKSVYVGCWTSKGIGIRWNGENDWKRLKCKGGCGLWAYSKPEKWELSGKESSHGVSCIKKRKRDIPAAQKTEEIRVDSEKSDTPIEEMEELREEIRAIKSQLADIRELLVGKVGHSSTEEQAEVQNENGNDEEDGETLPVKKKRKTKKWKRY